MAYEWVNGQWRFVPNPPPPPPPTPVFSPVIVSPQVGQVLTYYNGIWGNRIVYSDQIYDGGNSKDETSGDLNFDLND
jgi:hypothetical protein